MGSLVLGVASTSSYDSAFAKRQLTNANQRHTWSYSLLKIPLLPKRCHILLFQESTDWSVMGATLSHRESKQVPQIPGDVNMAKAAQPQSLPRAKQQTWLIPGQAALI